MVRCPRCGTQNDDSWDMCSNCGARLQTSAMLKERREREKKKMENFASETAGLIGNQRGQSQFFENIGSRESVPPERRQPYVEPTSWERFKSRMTAKPLRTELAEEREMMAGGMSRYGVVKHRFGKDVGTAVRLEKGIRSTINLKIKSRFTEAAIVCAIASFIIIFLHQNWLGAALFLLAFYTFLPNESDVMNEAREAVEEELRKEVGRESEEELGRAGERAYREERGRIRAHE